MRIGESTQQVVPVVACLVPACIVYVALLVAHRLAAGQVAQVLVVAVVLASYKWRGVVRIVSHVERGCELVIFREPVRQLGVHIPVAHMAVVVHLSWIVINYLFEHRLHDGIEIAHTTSDVIRGMSFPQRTVSLKTRGQHTCREADTMLFKVTFLQAYVHHTGEAAAITGRKCALVEYHIIHYFSIHSRGEPLQMFGIVERDAIHCEEVLVVITSTHINTCLAIASRLYAW